MHSQFFVGELIELKTVVINTTHQGDKTYLTGRFRTISSWKVVDREMVMVNLPGKESACAEFVQGSKYLIYAEKMGSNLYIALDSRTSRISSAIGENDLNQLGSSKISIAKGEFTVGNNQIFHVGIAFAIVVLLMFLFSLWLKTSDAKTNRN